jgi:hypothetical protein
VTAQEFAMTLVSSGWTLTSTDDQTFPILFRRGKDFKWFLRKDFTIDNLVAMLIEYVKLLEENRTANK